MYNIGTVTTTANSTKIMGTGTRWKDNTNLISVGQVIVIKNDTAGLPNEVNTIYSIESNTELTLTFPVSAKLTNAKYAISTTMIDSISDGVNKATAQVIASEIFTDIFTELMTGTGTLDFELPNGQKVKLRTEAERDKLLDGKFDKTGGQLNGNIFATGNIEAQAGLLTAIVPNQAAVRLNALNNTPIIQSRTSSASGFVNHSLQNKVGTLMHVGDYGLGTSLNNNNAIDNITDANLAMTTGFVASGPDITNFFSAYAPMMTMVRAGGNDGSGFVFQIQGDSQKRIAFRQRKLGAWVGWYEFYTQANTTKDSNGNLKAASPIIKVFADHIELNEESEGVEMVHLGTGHYLIKGVVGFNADGAWGINNGFVIPQDHNGKNMVLIDYDVKPDGDIEVFVFHQQNADMPERFQNKRIKHVDEEGEPVYFENYEPCDVPDSRWIDMRVEMPPNSIYNLKQAEAERLAKEAAEKQAEEDAKRAAEEAESAEQEAAERKQYGLGDNDVLL